MLKCTLKPTGINCSLPNFTLWGQKTTEKPQIWPHLKFWWILCPITPFHSSKSFCYSGHVLHVKLRLDWCLRRPAGTKPPKKLQIWQIFELCRLLYSPPHWSEPNQAHKNKPMACILFPWQISSSSVYRDATAWCTANLTKFSISGVSVPSLHNFEWRLGHFW